MVSELLCQSRHCGLHGVLFTPAARPSLTCCVPDAAPGAWAVMRRLSIARSHLGASCRMGKTYLQCTVIRAVIEVCEGVVLRQPKKANLPPRERQGKAVRWRANGGRGRVRNREGFSVDLRFIRVKGGKGYSKETDNLCTGLLCGVSREWGEARGLKCAREGVRGDGR